MLGDSLSIQNNNTGRVEENIPAAITDIGCEREINEDRYAVIDSASGRAWVVCDGMGGAMGGELAAQLAIDAIRRSLSSDNDSCGEAISTAIEEANRVIVLRRQNPAFSGMGTTVVSAIVNEDEVVITHAGDSRAYLVRDGVLQQLTTDHTYVQDLVERGQVTPEEALSHPQSHVLTRCLGAEPRLQLDLQEYWIWESSENEPQDKLVLCTDGLYSLVSDQEIADVVSKNSPQESCAQLVELAKNRGGYDNITLAVLPLGGQLREEAAVKREPQIRQKKVSNTVAQRRFQNAAPPLPIGMKLALMFLFMLLGVTVAAMAVLLSLAK